MKWILTISMMTVLFSFSAHAAEINGNWARGDGNARVRIAGCGKDICATNTWIKPEHPKENWRPAGDEYQRDCRRAIFRHCFRPATQPDLQDQRESRRR